ncbi:MAG: type IV pilus secretin PilQ [Xanthomonadales bacterium]|nr:type IV pilus secretin PilQ [Xanthomonadales bacterium]
MTTAKHVPIKTTAKRDNRLRQLAGLGVIFAAILATTGANAASRIEAVSFDSLPGGEVSVRIEVSGDPSEPQIFTTEEPPRIAIDFPDTTSASDRSITVNSGSTKAITAVEAGGRTRVVVDLYRPSSYVTEVDDGGLTLRVANGLLARSSSTAKQDPLKTAAVAPQRSLEKVDFRRGPAGEGRIMLQFTEAGASADLRREGDDLIIDIPDASAGPDIRQRLDVIDFATPVQEIQVRNRGAGTTLRVKVVGDYEQLAYQAGAEYVLEISPKREKPEEKRRATDPPVYVGNRVTFNFQDIPVRSVLQLIADVSELNIVVADSVQGNVTLRLVNVPWDQALDIILQAKGLDKRRNGTVIWVAPTAEIAEREQALEDARIALEDRAELISDFIPINYGKAKDIAELLTTDSLSGQSSGSGQQTGGSSGSASRKGFLSPRGSVTFDERTNTLLVSDVPKVVDEIRALVALLDQPVRQVLIESRIVVANDDFSREIGARFGVTGARENKAGDLFTVGGSLPATDRMANLGLINRSTFGAPTLPVGGAGIPPDGIAVPPLLERLAVNLPVLDPAGSIGFTVLAADTLLDLELSALESEGRGEVISSPRVITASQQEAIIRQGNEIPYTASQVDQTTGAITQTVQFKLVVLELRVTPTISPDDRVFMNLEVKQDSVSDFAVDGQPAINTRNIQTSVLVDSGQTVVLGGILERERRDDIRKVPVLGDIPALGTLFRNKRRSDQKAELLIFVTPKLLAESLR